MAQRWQRHREKVMYVVVGALNTLIAYACFSLLYYFFHRSLPPSAILAITYLVGSFNGYLTFRYWVFKPAAHPIVEYLRYQVVYLPLFALNLIVLPLALEHSGLNAYLIQALFAAFAVVASYVGNKYYTFRDPQQRK